MKMPAEGAGKRATTWSKDRLQFKACNMKRCMVPAADPVTKCNETLDIVFLIDGSGSLGQSGWDAEIKAAKMFVDSAAAQRAGDFAKTDATRNELRAQGIDADIVTACRTRHDAEMEAKLEELLQPSVQETLPN